IGREAESIIRVTEVWRDAAPSRAAGDLDVVAPGAAARCLALARGRAGRVVRGRVLVVALVVPVGAPLVNVLADVVKAVTVGRGCCDRLGTFAPPLGIGWARGGGIIAPGEELLVQAAASREFPFGFSRQPEFHPPPTRELHAELD